MENQHLLNWLEYGRWLLTHARHLRQFKDIHAGESCFIIGNGPSLNAMDLSLLHNRHTFGLNKIYLMRDRVDLNLSYHVAVNPLVIQQSHQEFESLHCPSFLDYRASKNVIRHRKHINFIFIDARWTFYPNILRGISAGFTVTYVAMQIAFYMGFQQVFLIGVDHNFTAVGQPNETQLLHDEDPNHFDPRYFQNHKWQLPDLEASELAYHLARFHFQRAGRQIYDATVNGKLNIFPKVSYAEALKMSEGGS